MTEAFPKERAAKRRFPLDSVDSISTPPPPLLLLGTRGSREKSSAQFSSASPQVSLTWLVIVSKLQTDDERQFRPHLRRLDKFMIPRLGGDNGRKTPGNQ
jgi:hypothetical protein